MLNKTEFERWIRASHAMFETFEGRFDAYPVAERCVHEWLSSGSYSISQEDNDVIVCLARDFPYDVFRNSRDRLEADENWWRTFVKISSPVNTLMSALRSCHSCLRGTFKGSSNTLKNGQILVLSVTLEI